MIEIKESGAPLTEREIDDFERHMGCSLPREYRGFLLKHNGGRPSPYWFSYVDDNGRPDRDAVNVFYSLGPDALDYCSLLWHMECFKGRIPSGMFAIGDDPCGNLICIIIKGDQVGELFLWNHEGEHSPPTYKNVVYLANSFLRFIDGLHEVQHDFETPIDFAIRKDDVTELHGLLGDGADLEIVDPFGRTMLENAVIQNAVNVFEWLYTRGAQLKRSLEIAGEITENLRSRPEFLAKHERIVHLIGRLTQKQ